MIKTLLISQFTVVIRMMLLVISGVLLKGDIITQDIYLEMISTDTIEAITGLVILGGVLTWYVKSEAFTALDFWQWVIDSEPGTVIEMVSDDELESILQEEGLTS